jgi:hypothetical protein
MRFLVFCENSTRSASRVRDDLNPRRSQPIAQQFLPPSISTAIEKPSPQAAFQTHPSEVIGAEPENNGGHKTRRLSTLRHERLVRSRTSKIVIALVASDHHRSEDQQPTNER